VRGEQESASTGSTPPLGPSPRARGAGEAPALPGEELGTIPACAGSRFKRP